MIGHEQEQRLIYHLLQVGLKEKKKSLCLLLPASYHVIIYATESTELQHHHSVGLLNRRPSHYYGFDVLLLTLVNHLRVLLNIQPDSSLVLFLFKKNLKKQ